MSINTILSIKGYEEGFPLSELWGGNAPTGMPVTAVNKLKVPGGTVHQVIRTLASKPGVFVF